MYELKAIVMHSGTSEGGHYYMLRKNSDGWYMFDDTNVQKVSKNNSKIGN